MTNQAAMAVERSENQKTGLVSVTMTSQASCPESCAFFNSGCYAENYPQSIHTNRLNKHAETSPEAIAQFEADAIKTLSGKRPLRLHIVGDAKTDAAAEILADAVANYPQPVWAYTHAWRDVSRVSWGRVSALASCETVQDAKRANAAGYAAAVVVESFASTKAYSVDGMKLIPCPAQTHKGIQCVDCKLCWDDSKLRQIGANIAFEPHGDGEEIVRAKVAELVQIGGVK